MLCFQYYFDIIFITEAFQECSLEYAGEYLGRAFLEKDHTLRLSPYLKLNCRCFRGCSLCCLLSSLDQRLIFLEIGSKIYSMIQNSLEDCSQCNHIFCSLLLKVQSFSLLLVLGRDKISRFWRKLSCIFGSIHFLDQIFNWRQSVVHSLLSVQAYTLGLHLC